MDVQNLHGRTEFTLTSGFVYGRTKFAWTHRICMDTTLNLHGGVVELVGGGSVIHGVLSCLVFRKGPC